jgi:hypothetical protein
MSLLLSIAVINITNKLLEINNNSIIRDVQDFLPLVYNPNIVWETLCILISWRATLTTMYVPGRVTQA